MFGVSWLRSQGGLLRSNIVLLRRAIFLQLETNSHASQALNCGLSRSAIVSSRRAIFSRIRGLTTYLDSVISYCHKIYIKITLQLFLQGFLEFYFQIDLTHSG